MRPTSPPVPHDPDRSIGEWYAHEPERRVPLGTVALWFGVGVLAWALTVAGGVELGRLVWQVLR